MLRLPSALALLAAPAVVADLRIGLLSDLHVGEGCASPYNGQEDCYSVENLKRAVAYINDVLVPRDGLQYIFVTGDVSSSAEPAQFAKARALLNELSIPVLPAFGNHDCQEYSAINEAPYPNGDALFEATFGDLFVNSPVVTAWSGNVSVPNPEVQNGTHTSMFQNFEVTLTDPATNQDLVFFGLDFNTRMHALPGYKGTLPQAAIHNITGGTLPWLDDRLGAARAKTPARYFLMHHQPYRCPFPIPDWAFCFSGPDKTAVQDVLALHNPIDAYWGVFAGHLHIFSNGTAFDDWPGFVQWETSACKGSAVDPNITSAIAAVTIKDADVVRIDTHWWYQTQWYNATGL